MIKAISVCALAIEKEKSNHKDYANIDKEQERKGKKYLLVLSTAVKNKCVWVCGRI